MNPTADPDANTVFDHKTFSALSGSTVGAETIGTSSSFDMADGGGLFTVNVPMNVWISLIGSSA
jgi:hypothetical protein